jgi:tRNA threonylcarbamoyladenosine biosynthesis protein TsaE
MIPNVITDPSMKQIVTHSAEETTAWGREFAKRLSAPMLVLLSGDLGSGKTTLTKGIVSGLGAATEDEVTSPTFTLVHVYGPKATAQSTKNAATTASEFANEAAVPAAQSASNASGSTTDAAASAARPAPPRVYHADLYRIESFHDFETLGLEDMFDTPSIAIFEWSERFPLKSPWPQIRLHLEHAGADNRRISIS